MLVANNAQRAVIPIPGQETEVPLVRHVLRLAKLNLPRLIPVPMGPIKLRLPATPVSGSFCVVCTLMLFVKGTIFVQRTRKLKQVSTTFLYFPLLSSTFLCRLWIQSSFLGGPCRCMFGLSRVRIRSARQQRPLPTLCFGFVYECRHWYGWKQLHDVCNQWPEQLCHNYVYFRHQSSRGHL
jgi:hypothetical protein